MLVIDDDTVDEVWIELQKDTDNIEVNHRRAEKLSQVLKSIWGIDYNPIWYSEREGKYCYQTSSAGTYLILTDRGHWFNLDFLQEKLAGFQTA